MAMTIEELVLTRLRDEEDALVERKSTAHHSEVRAAVCAFANSMRAPETGVLFLGVDRKGEPTGTISDADKTQRDVHSWVTQCYPLIGGVQTYALEVNGKAIVAVMVPESRDRPHFTGPAFIRDGSQTREASKEQFQRLVEDRSDLVWELRPHIGKAVTVQEERFAAVGVAAWDQGTERILDAVTQFFVNVRSERGIGMSYSARRIDLEYDVGEQRPRLRVRLK